MSDANVLCTTDASSSFAPFFSALDRGFSVTFAPTEEAMNEALATGHYDLVCVEWKTSSTAPSAVLDDVLHHVQSTTMLLANDPGNVPMQTIEACFAVLSPGCSFEEFEAMCTAAVACE